MTKRKNKKSEDGKDLSSLVGMKYNMLTIKEILPRERDENGLLKSASVLCECECGNLKKLRLYDVTCNNVLSCGCMRGKHCMIREENVPDSIIEALAAIYYCPYPTTTCVRSKKLHLCCHECERNANCPQACQNTIDKCNAAIRDDLMPKGKMEDMQKNDGY